MRASRIGRPVGLLLGFALLAAACSGNSSTAGPGPTGTQPADCKPGSSRCQGAQIMLCSETGTSELTLASCQLPTVCRAGKCVNGAPEEQKPVCTPAQAMCDGEIATRCKDDGSGPLPDGVDCAESKQQCIQGKCSGGDDECVPGTKSCLNGDVYLCDPNGAGLAVFDYCAEDEFCFADTGSCLAQICKPDEVSCKGTRVVTCNALGTAFLPGSLDCAATSEVCRAGSCGKRACTPSSTFCHDGNLHQCDPTGTGSTLAKTCTKYEHCQVTPAGLYAYCEPDACVAGDKLCIGNVIKTCSDDGSIPVEGIACGEDEFCESATCKPRLCALDTTFCKGTGIFVCNNEGPVLAGECEAGNTCVDLNPGAPTNDSSMYQCAQWACPPGKTGCLLNRVGICAADGASLSSMTVDCTANAQICAPDGTCAASVTETLGQDDSVQPFDESTFIGNLIDVRSARKLTELQSWLVFTSTRELRWIVYEQVDEWLVARAEKTTTAVGSSGFVGSGPLSFSYQLQAGKRYALGVLVSGSSVGAMAWTPLARNPSFGALIGTVWAYGDSMNVHLTSNLNTTTASLMKVTTAP